MFLRRYQRKKNGKRHTYWALVESYRTARGSRQRVVAYLGELKRNERNGWVQLGRRLAKKDRPSPTLFDPPTYPEPGTPSLLVPGAWLVARRRCSSPCQARQTNPS